MQIVPPVQIAFEVTFDSQNLSVAMSVFDVTTGAPVLVQGPTAMINAIGNTYFGQFTPIAGKQYLIHKAVYQSGSFAALSDAYGQASETILCKADQAVDFKKGVALPNFAFPMTSSVNHTPLIGLTPTVEISTDGGPFLPSTNEPTEVEAGIYKINLTADDMNGKVLSLKFSAAGADTRFATVVTQT